MLKVIGFAGLALVLGGQLPEAVQLPVLTVDHVCLSGADSSAPCDREQSFSELIEEPTR